MRRLWNALLNLSISECRLGLTNEATESAQESLSLSIKEGDKAHKAISLASLCSIELRRGNASTAARFAAEALEIWQSDPAPIHVSNVLWKCCDIAMLTNDLKRAAWFRGAADRTLSDSRGTPPLDNLDILDRFNDLCAGADRVALKDSEEHGASAAVDQAILEALTFCRDCINLP